jgi:hypothetical protein
VSVQVHAMLREELDEFGILLHTLQRIRQGPRERVHVGPVLDEKADDFDISSRTRDRRHERRLSVRVESLEGSSVRQGGSETCKITFCGECVKSHRWRHQYI